MLRVRLYVNACNGWPQFALQHHWLLPINCHFLQLYSAAGRGIAAVSSAIEESDLLAAFNMMDHDILLQRLHSYFGVSGRALARGHGLTFAIRRRKRGRR